MSNPKPVRRKQRPGRFGKTYSDFLTDGTLAALMEKPGGRDAVSLWALANAWSALHLKDGHIPRATVTKVLFGRPRDAARLVEVGLWTVEDDGWYIVKYWYGNLMRADIEAQKLSGAISVCKRYMQASTPKPCSCGHHTAKGDLVGDPVGDLLRALLPPEAFDD